MDAKFKLNAIAVFALAVAFYGFFMFTKHDPSVAAIIPFGEDPYDAIGSFCMIISALLGLLSLFRAFRPYRKKSQSPLRKAFLARTQIAIPLGMLIALAADGIAMARHTSEWTGKPSTSRLLALLVGMAALSLGALLSVRRSARGIDLPVIQNQPKRAVIMILAFVLVLALFPEDVIHSIALHFLTIVLGFALIAAAQAALAMALLPFDAAWGLVSTSDSRPGSKSWIQWSAIAGLGIAIGLWALMGEMFGEGARGGPLFKSLIVPAIFVGAGTSALLIAFGFLKRPLGLFREMSRN